MKDKINALELALAKVRAELLAADVTTPGFGEIRAMYNDLSDSLIRAAHKQDDEVAARLQTTVTEIAEEWESNQSALGNWTGVLEGVVRGIGSVLEIAGLPNPLTGLLKGVVGSVAAVGSSATQETPAADASTASESDTPPTHQKGD